MLAKSQARLAVVLRDDVEAEQFHERVAEWLEEHAPANTDEADLDALFESLIDPKSEHFDALIDWYARPLAPWAGPLPPGFTFPAKLLAWLADPPAPFTMTMACGSCGLVVPVPIRGAEDSCPFRDCPGCGSRTTSTALSAPLSRAELS
jgi:hypothetical protein